MESANNLKLPDQVVVVVGSNSNSPLNLADPSTCFAFGSHANWSSSSSSSSTPNFSCSNSNPSYDLGIVSNSSTSTTSQKSSDQIDHQSNNITNLVPSDHHDHDHLNNNNNNNILVNELLGFPWNNNTTTTTTRTTQSSSYDMQVLAKIKQELSESLPRFTDLLNSPSSSDIDDYGHFLLASHIKTTTTTNHNMITKDLLINRSSSSMGSQSNGRDHLDYHDHDQIPGEDYDGRRRGQFSQIYPSINISNLLNNNYQYYKPALDHLAAPARFMGTTDNLNDNISLAVLRDSNVRTSLISNNINDNLGLVQMQRPHDRLLCARSNQVISSANGEMMEIAKRSSNLTETKLINNQLTSPNKKSRSESRTSCPPFKVRKEKLGDRIAALQQLVSPFGKTDTASVLMEAIGYIKFLQNQVETLSVPYMKSHNKSTKTLQRGLKEEGISSDARRDLRSRGLCLVPLSCMSYVTGDHGGGGGSIWPPPNFGGRT